MNRDKLKAVLTNPLAWIASGIGSTVAVFLSIGIDPISGLAAVFSVFSSQAMSLFTAGSIMGFTIAPELPSVPAAPFQALAIAAGIVAVAGIASRVWDRIKAEVREE